MSADDDNNNGNEPNDDVLPGLTKPITARKLFNYFFKLQASRLITLLLVFAVLGIVVVSVLTLLRILFSGCVLDDDNCSFQSLYFSIQAFKPFLSLAGAALVAMYILKKDDLLVGLFGMALIGALILSVDDLIKLAVVVFKIEDQYENVLQNPEELVDNQAVYSTATQLAGEITEKIIRDIVETDMTPQEQQTIASLEARMVTLIHDSLIDSNEDLAIARLRSRSLFTILENIGENGVDDLITRFSGNAMNKDLEELRSEGAVTFLYKEYSGLEISSFGCQLLQRSLQTTRSGLFDWQLILEMQTRYPQCASYASEFLPGVPTEPPSLSDGGSNREMPSVCYSAPEAFGEVTDYSTYIDLTSFGSCYTFSVAESGQYFIESDSIGGDPLITLYELQNPQAVIGDDDDSGTGFNARLVQELDASAEYVLYLNSWQDADDGFVRISPAPEGILPIPDFGVESPSACALPVSALNPAAEAETLVLYESTYYCRTLDTPGDSYTVSVEALDAADPRLKIFDQAGTLISDEEDTIGMGLGARTTIVAAGTYTIVVEGWSDGNIRLGVAAPP